jgi:beta-galactosidase
LEFDGVYRDCLVFVNGYCLGRHESGYDSFRYDITDVAVCGVENIVAVRVDASKFEGWFYEGAGIYRHVWLQKTSALAVAPDGIFVYSKFKGDQPDGPAKIFLETQLQNRSPNVDHAKAIWQILGPDGKVVVSTDKSASLNPWDEATIRQTTKISSPKLWSPESPQLYKLITVVQTGGQIVDRVETEFGIRTFAFDASKGFLLNGKPYVIQGTCNHQDHAGVGSALPDALQDFRIQKLKEMGGNAYRTSHNAPTPELLDACDRLGMLVMDENRLLGSDPEHLARLENLVRRDRNHASVFMWSIANEEYVQALPSSAKVAETMQRLIHRLDATRAVTAAVCLGNVFTGVNRVVDVRGWNYNLGPATDNYHREHPEQPNIGSEQASTMGTRGIYSDEATNGYVSAYDHSPYPTHTAEGWWSFTVERPWLSGGFVWTGFDYRGEPSPYDWPCISSHFGILDTCGFPKDNFFYYQSWWTTNTVLHLLPHWNWPGKEGRDIEVWCHSNCQEVELFLNGQSQGKKAMPRNSHLQWTVKYTPGTLSAKGYIHGKEIAETKVETTGTPARIQLVPDRSRIFADGKDLSMVTVLVTDAEGRRVPTADDLIHFELTGPGKIIGVGNGDPSCHEPDVYLSQPATLSGTMNQWWMMKVKPDSEAKEHPEVVEKAIKNHWDWYAVQTDYKSGGLDAGQWAVYRARPFLSDMDLALTNYPIRFGSIRDDGWIYVNGKLAGESHDPAASPSFDVRKFMHSGFNTIAVLVRSKQPSGGLCRGVRVELQNTPAVANWKRSVFNGLAQIIVQSDQTIGDIKLTATADGLSPATTIIHAVSETATVF